MIQKTFLALAAWASLTSMAHSELVINIGSVTVDISSGSGMASASFDVFIENVGISSPGDDEVAYGYNLLYDIAPVSPGSYPLGVSLDATTPVESGNLFPGTIGLNVNQSPAAGDFAVAEAQFTPVTFAAGTNQLLHTVNLQIDRSLAVAGDYQITIDSSSASDGISDSLLTVYDPVVNAGVLSITAIPEPSSIGFLAVAGVALGFRRRRR
ncbi:PEP-CTERM sorting domain-containing protein [Stieleria sp. JC731]|uniref:PEP-CTERM sorting domain-containing protein n=1 Tax=Pirellulaceae TaxID=2691357 RepID=UPI001E3E5C46|nr:PEP-CTERM sorting domain-containing protein [Stieleria sp. JC731]MCC9604143.1 PEP-CTERM sorting domain-containing protein [Stieleria sp. JC731]